MFNPVPAEPAGDWLGALYVLFWLIMLAIFNRSSHHSSKRDPRD